MNKFIKIMDMISWMILIVCVLALFFISSYKHSIEVRFMKQVIEQIEQEQEIDFTQDKNGKVSV